MDGAIVVRGEGIAALSCTCLLQRAGLSVSTEAAARPKLPAIMLSEATQKLLQDVFDRSDLFAGLPRVRRRVVAWGPAAKPVELPHSAVVAAEEEILNRLLQPELCGAASAPVWTIFASRPLPHGVQEMHFGSRIASAASVKLKPGSQDETCWIESVDNGWLFLLPSLQGNWLLSVGGPVDSQLGRSRVIADQVQAVHPGGSDFASHPRIAETLCADAWLACGTAALGFDPLCGDGVGNAAREAILACAVVRAALAGADVDAVTAHYSGRLLAGFRRHLEVCEEFYRSGGPGPWWQEQLAAARRGIEWCESRLAGLPRSGYRLNGFSLEALR